ncbi:Holliday junction resolvase-like protein [Streptomyces albireticuli]|uniref:Holliday junction resolvase-like protein n=1 Tax=Streptomyces albireticuli TaxID=1940 RepID=UPI0036C2BD01
MFSSPPAVGRPGDSARHHHDGRLGGDRGYGGLTRARGSRRRHGSQRADEAHHELRIAVENHQMAEENHEKALTERGKIAVRNSRGTFDSHVAENAFPYAAEHSYHSKDIVHVSGNIDFHVFDGLFEICQGTRKPEELRIVLADVKYGFSTLTCGQRAVLAAIGRPCEMNRHLLPGPNRGSTDATRQGRWGQPADPSQQPQGSPDLGESALDTDTPD